MNAYGLGRPRNKGVRLEAQAARNLGILMLWKKRVEEQGQELPLIRVAMEWDAKFAPMTTNEAQLRDLGITAGFEATTQWDALDEMEYWTDSQVRQRLCETIEGMADLGHFFVETDGISDRDMYAILWTKVLKEVIPDVPPSFGTYEIISLSAVNRRDSISLVERDRFLPHPEVQVKA